MRLFIKFVVIFLGGCTANGGKLADPKADADGRNFIAKAGLSRLYIVHGNAREEIDSRKQIVTIPMAVGIAIGSAAKSAFDPTQPEGKPLFVSGTYFLNGHNIGDIGKGQYMAVDVFPGKYTVSYVQNSLSPVKSSVYELEIDSGKTIYVRSDFVISYENGGAFIVRCQEDCIERVLSSHRVIANWP